MICAYDKMYLEKARTNLGRMLDFAVYQLNYDIDEFFDMFIVSGMAKRFERGDINIIAGMSGVEVGWEVIYKLNGSNEHTRVEYQANRSPEYWAGWALAYYQWLRNVSFADIVEKVAVSKIIAMYSPYHEMDINHFVDKMDELYSDEMSETKLKQRRIKAGMTQGQLAEASEVPVRTIQQYEQRQKDINKAAGMTLKSLATALYCRIEDLME